MLCALTAHRTGAPIIEPLSVTERDALLESAADEGFDQFPDVQRRVATALARVPAFRLSVGADPDAAVAAVAQLAHRVRETTTL
jgi:hypothetical protein